MPNDPEKYFVASLTYTSRGKRTKGWTFLRRVSLHREGCAHMPEDGRVLSHGTWAVVEATRDEAKARVADALEQGAEVRSNCRYCMS